MTFGQHASNAGPCELRPQAMSLLKAGSLVPHRGKGRVEVACSPNTTHYCHASLVSRAHELSPPSKPGRKTLFLVPLYGAENEAQRGLVTFLRLHSQIFTARFKLSQSGS